MGKIKIQARQFFAVMGPEKGKFALNSSGEVIVATNKRSLTKQSLWRRGLRIVRVSIEVSEI